jgi:hypothetical protein
MERIRDKKIDLETVNVEDSGLLIGFFPPYKS